MANLIGYSILGENRWLNGENKSSLIKLVSKKSQLYVHVLYALEYVSLTPDKPVNYLNL
jgi:hypothetical protein